MVLGTNLTTNRGQLIRGLGTIVLFAVFLYGSLIMQFRLFIGSCSCQYANVKENSFLQKKGLFD
jgi:hypothetical protein